LDRCDEKLVRRALDGDAAAFAALVERYRGAAYGIGLHVLSDPHEAADAAQEAFIRAWRALDQLRDAGKFSGWLCRIAANTARQRLRARRSAEQLIPFGEVGPMESRQKEAHDRAVEKEVVRLVEELVGQLSDEQRLAFTLFYVNGYSYGELSRMLQLPEGTVKSHLARARERVREGMLDAAAETLAGSKPGAEFWRAATGAACGCVRSAAGRPIARATIGLVEDNISRHTRAESGDDGTWSADGLVPGTYHVTASHPDFVWQAYPGRDAGKSTETSVVIRPGQTVRDVDFRLEPAANLHGTVQAEGSPIAGAVVTLYRTVTEHSLRYPPAHQEETNGDGKFKIPGVREGSYLVAARTPAEAGRRFPRPPATFYPGTFSPSEAKPIALSPEEPPAGLSIELASSGSASLRVVVTDADSGHPVPEARVRVTRRDLLFYEFGGLAGGDGVFQTEMVGTGPFQVTVSAPEGGYVRWAKWVDIAQEGEEAEVAVELLKGAVFEGRLVTEDGSEPPLLPDLRAHVAPEAPELIDGRPRRNAEVRGPDLALAEGPQSEPLRVEEGGRISSPPVAPGKVRIAADTRDPEWRLLRVTTKGRTLGDGDEIKCKPGERIDDLTIVIGTNLGIVAGRVVSERSKEPMPNVWVHLSRRDEQFFRAQPIETDRTGSFLFHAVPAGPYTLGLAPSRHGPTDEETSREIRVEPDRALHVDVLLRE
jgi:RNA polymerase sigma-70 factor (ECF subfamily)